MGPHEYAPDNKCACPDCTTARKIYLHKAIASNVPGGSAGSGATKPTKMSADYEIALCEEEKASLLHRLQQVEDRLGVLRRSKV